MKIFGKMIPSLLGMMGKKTNTVRYPYIQAAVSDRFRGALRFHGDRCVGCKLCERVCPSDAIYIREEGEKKYKATVLLAKCIFCGQCVDSCHKGALENTTGFELATSDKASLKVEI